jgi:hypothetical protein
MMRRNGCVEKLANRRAYSSRFSVRRLRCDRTMASHWSILPPGAQRKWHSGRTTTRQGGKSQWENENSVA